MQNNLEHIPVAKTADIDIPCAMLDKWQSVVDLIARIGKVRAALIMRIRGEELEVFLASRTGTHPYRVGSRTCFAGSGLYCERIIRDGQMLLVPDASRSGEWKNNPDMQYRMKCYLGFPIRFPDGSCFGTICMLDDKENDFSQDMRDFMEKMRDLIESYLLLLQMSFTDSLTGLYNRTYFDQVLQREIRNAEQSGKPVTAMMLDIDRFKNINDTFGHLAGDDVLKAFAKTVSDSVRSTDFSFRVGGDEFYVLMPGTGTEFAREAAEKLRASIENSRLFPGFSLTASIGVAGWMPGETASEWMRRTDRALYQAKRAQGNRVAG